MEKVMLDTNFILSCIQNKIDFFEELTLKGFGIIIPVQVISELERIKNSKKKLMFRENARLALRLIESNTFEKVDLGKGAVDDLIVKFLKKNNNVVLATLDKELKKRANSRKISIVSKKKLDFV
jgi:rRNA-processing protein FCF1